LNPSANRHVRLPAGWRTYPRRKKMPPCSPSPIASGWKRRENSGSQCCRHGCSPRERFERRYNSTAYFSTKKNACKPCSPTCATSPNYPTRVGRYWKKKTLPNGLKLRRQRVPLGVLAVIYEARPNVTVDVAGLGLKSGKCGNPARRQRDHPLQPGAGRCHPAWVAGHGHSCRSVQLHR